MVRGDHTKLAIDDPLHDYMVEGEEHKYLMAFDTDQDSEDDVYSLTVETYSGNIKVGFYTDSEMEKPFQTHPVVYRGKSKYIFSSKLLKSKTINELYVRIIVNNGPVTITSLLEKELPNVASELEKNVYNFVSLNEKTLLFFQF
jgi:hypothetical protein